MYGTSHVQVKSVFVDVIPPSWDESKVREHFAQYGEIERVVLAKDNPKSKRNDYAFVDYASRESAVACVEALKSGVLVDGDTKVRHFNGGNSWLLFRVVS
jgi:RNA recognition motif-containing protein